MTSPVAQSEEWTPRNRGTGLTDLQSRVQGCASTGTSGVVGGGGEVWEWRFRWFSWSTVGTGRTGEGLAEEARRDQDPGTLPTGTA